MKAKRQFARAAVLTVFTLTATLGAYAQTTPPPANQQTKAPAQQQADAREPNVPAKGTALVELHDGLLHISASDADLNTVLQQVARVTGMRLQGSAGGDRVFGDYGPAAPAEVLNHLLDGVPCNFVLKQEPGTDAPQELVISARSGGTMTADQVPAARTPSGRFIPPAAQAAAPQEQPEQPEQAEPVEETPVEQAAPEIPPPPPAAQEQPNDNSGAPNPNAIKTPQQFMDELNTMRQQQQGRPPQ